MPRLCEPHEIPLRFRFPWEKWADGEWRTLWKDQDFPNETPRQVYDCAKNQAKRHGLQFAGHVRGDSVLLQLWHEKAADDGTDTQAEPTPE